MPFDALYLDALGAKIVVVMHLSYRSWVLSEADEYVKQFDFLSDEGTPRAESPRECDGRSLTWVLPLHLKEFVKSKYGCIGNTHTSGF